MAVIPQNFNVLIFDTVGRSCCG